MLSSHLQLCLLSGLFLSGFSTKILYTFLISSCMLISPLRLILFDLIILTIFHLIGNLNHSTTKKSKHIETMNIINAWNGNYSGITRLYAQQLLMLNHWWKDIKYTTQWLTEIEYINPLCTFWKGRQICPPTFPSPQAYPPKILSFQTILNRKHIKEMFTYTDFAIGFS